jgi:SnoaL-like domain
MTDTTTTPDITATVDAYVAMFNETDDARRLELTRRAFADDGSFVDPMFSASGGPQAISEVIGGAQAQFPGHVLTRTSGIDAHHAVVRFSWQLADEDGTVTVPGLDIGVIAEDGRLSRIAGFFGPLPAA